MDLKLTQEAYDRCDFTEEQKKSFPRPETEEDLKRFEKLLYTPTEYPSNWGHSLLLLIL